MIPQLVTASAYTKVVKWENELYDMEHTVVKRQPTPMQLQERLLFQQTTYWAQ